jgi:hypothetical protein
VHPEAVVAALQVRDGRVAEHDPGALQLA